MNRQRIRPFRRLAALMGAAMALTAFASAADEIAVQGGTSTGGDAYSIGGYYYGETRFSVTGRFNDVADMFAFDGVLEHSYTVRQLWNGQSPFQIVDKVQLADGRSRVLLRMTNTPWYFDGGFLRLRSGGYEFDRDPIRLR